MDDQAACTSGNCRFGRPCAPSRIGSGSQKDLLIGGAGSRLSLTHVRGSRARTWRLGLDGPRFTVDRAHPTLSGRWFGLSANGRFALTADADGQTTIRDVTTWRPVHRLRASSTAADDIVRTRPVAHRGRGQR